MDKSTTEKQIEPILLHIKQVCSLLNISRTSLLRLTRDGQIKTVKIHGRVLIHRDELDRYINSLWQA